MQAKSRIDAFAAGIMLVLCVTWGFQQVASKVALNQGLPPLFTALARSLIAAPLVITWLGMRRGWAGLAGLMAPDGTVRAGSLTAVLFALEFVCLFEGMRLTSVSRAVIVLYTAAFFTAAGAHFFVRGERLRPVNVMGLLLAFAGVGATIGVRGGSVAGDALVLLAAAAWGLTTVVVKASPALQAAEPEKVLAYQLVGSVPILALTAALGGELHVPQATTLAWVSLLFQGVVVSFTSYLTWFWLIRRYPAGRLAAFSFFTPLFGVLAAALFLGEPLTPLLLVGMACVGAGLRLVNR